MEYRQLGSSDLKVSVLGFGAWGIGGSPFWTTEGDRASEKALLKAVELGINFFDTAPVYGFGHSESLIGKALKPHRDKLIYATKCGLRWEKESLGSIRKVATRASIEEEIELSLKRLQTDVIDLYQVHWPDVDTPQAETMETLLRLKGQGKIRHIGVSNYNTRQMQECLEVGPIVSLQPEYSLLQRSIEKEIVPYCRGKNIGIVAYSPLASGVLTGKYGKDTKFKDWRSKGIIGEFTGEAFERNVEKVEKMKAIAEALGKTCAHVAINWVTHQPAVATALIGVKNEKQMEENVQAVGWKLEDDVLKRLDEIFAVK
ncbi:aldo/keto reductase [Nitrospina gracilis]|uniref:aldo/keto reductase n=1 Tax=Nitrospina gracilis TaxID=35801 RepID=UPI001F40EB7C|nr:aldo/keto reductase [Nitrospina gracilis]MCF8720114.1 aryl-alcohol dehydrogenase-like predicted oxidoreductase [Nitrospina gracilis Nb-211]